MFCLLDRHAVNSFDILKAFLALPAMHRIPLQQLNLLYAESNGRVDKIVPYMTVLVIHMNEG